MLRTAPICILIFLGVAFMASAEDQELHIAELLQTRNTSTAPVLYQNKTYGVADQSFTKGYGGLSMFNFLTRFKLKQYETRTFATKDYWNGDFKFNANQANAGKSAYVDASKIFATKAAATRVAYEQDKQYGTRTYDTRQYLGKGKDQKMIDQQGVKVFEGRNPLGIDAPLHPLTIDEIREMLNKPK